MKQYKTNIKYHLANVELLLKHFDYHNSLTIYAIYIILADPEAEKSSVVLICDILQ